VAGLPTLPCAAGPARCPYAGRIWLQAQAHNLPPAGMIRRVGYEPGRRRIRGLRRVGLTMDCRRVSGQFGQLVGLLKGGLQRMMLLSS